MSEASSFPTTQTNQPPPAPPLPPSRLGPFQRLVAPLGLSRGTRPSTDQAAQEQRQHVPNVRRQSYGALPSQTVAHRTGIPIAALDINAQGTHAILAGKDILKTVQVQDGKATEDFNLRADILSYASTHGLPQSEATNDRRNYLPARAVKWSIGKFDHIIATAAATGRIALYDVRANGSRVELAWLQDHKGQVNKLDFDPSQGYYLLSASSDKTVTLWDIREGKGTKAAMRFVVNSGVRDVKWSPKESNNSDFAICADGGIIQSWDVRNPYAAKLSMNAHDRGCFSLDWHPDGRHVVSGGFDKYVRVWDFKNDNRRQKPMFQFRAPQAIRNVRWRPPSWSSETTESGTWQTTQIATTYHYDDPRIHIWDFRRPLIPFREIDMYNAPANDFLWASKDRLWTVGDQGMFTQNDVSYATQVYSTLPPCALGWTPDGEFAAFSEERLPRRPSGMDDPALSFLGVPQEKFSGSGDDGMHSRSFEDDEEDMPDETVVSTSLHRHQTRSQGAIDALYTSSPPTEAPKLVLPLHEAVIAGLDSGQDDQTGTFGRIEGVGDDPQVVSFLASNYSLIASEYERRTSPDKILTRLEHCFMANADVCDEVSLHRMAQSWRILAAVIVPELKDWAESNRARRKAQAARQKALPNVDKSNAEAQSSPAFAKISMRDPGSKAGGSSERPLSNLFKGIKEAELGHLNGSSSASNATTPLARPAQRSPLPTQQQQRSREHSDASGGIDDLQTLPPSLLSSHSTAAAAVGALADDGSVVSETPPSSPDQRRDRADPRAKDVDADSRSPSLPLSPHAYAQTSKPIGSPRPTQTQEERRAALREYRAQPRPVFSLDAPVRNTDSQKGDFHGSSESFSMFSASSTSSFKGPSFGRSMDSPERMLKPVAGSWLSREDSSESASSDIVFGAEHANSQNSYNRPEASSSSVADFAVDDLGEAKTQGLAKNATAGSLPAAFNTAVTQASSPELFHFDQSGSPPLKRIPVTNPVLRQSVEKQNIARGDSSLANLTGTEEMDSDEYVFSDFKPIDLTKYEPRLPFGWSALPLVCQMIAFDVGDGVGCGQFAAHLILHIAPYFFHKSLIKQESLGGTWPLSLADRLMRPDLSHRIIEALLLQHCVWLRRMRFYQSFAEVRKACAELGFERVSSMGFQPSKDGSSSTSDPHLIAAACSHCSGPLKPGQSVCERCHRPRAVCPICLSSKPNQIATSGKQSHSPNLWSYCQACAHSSHLLCLSTWLTDPSSNGVCPVPTCNCDCGPGLVRQERIEHQIKAQEEGKLIRGNGSSATIKKDGMRASQSAAVDKARAVLRADSTDRGTQSGDERGNWGRRVSGRGSTSRTSVGGGFTSGSRKSVRLVTPGEEENSTAK